MNQPVPCSGVHLSTAARQRNCGEGRLRIEDRANAEKLLFDEGRSAWDHRGAATLHGAAPFSPSIERSSELSEIELELMRVKLSRSRRFCPFGYAVCVYAAAHLSRYCDLSHGCGSARGSSD